MAAMTMIRALLPGDVPAVQAALASIAPDTAHAGGHDTFDELLAAALCGAGAGVIAVGHASPPLGIALLSLTEESVAHVRCLWVAPDVRRRGLARAMLAALAPAFDGRAGKAEIPAAADSVAVTALLGQFGFRARAGSPQLLHARRVKTTPGRASLSALR